VRASALLALALAAACAHAPARGPALARVKAARRPLRGFRASRNLLAAADDKRMV